jgi:hypothetical protein
MVDFLPHCLFKVEGIVFFKFLNQLPAIKGDPPPPPHFTQFTESVLPVLKATGLWSGSPLGNAREYSMIFRRSGFLAVV